MSTELGFNNNDPAYLDALSQLAKVLVTYDAQYVHELIEEDLGDWLLFDLSLAIAGVNAEFSDDLAKLARGEQLAKRDPEQPGCSNV